MIRSRKTLRGTLIIGGFIFGYMKFLICGMLVSHNGLTNIAKIFDLVVLHLYFIYYRYSGLACMIVLVLGSSLSLMPGLKQREKPDHKLLVPVMQVSHL